MPNVLSVDLSSSIARASLFQIGAQGVTVLESHSVECGNLFESLAVSATAAAEALPTENAANGSATVELSPTALAEQRAQKLIAELVGQLRHEHESSVMIIRPLEYISLNLEVPFTDQKQIERVLALEVQDRVPFDAAEFFMVHQRLGQYGAQNEVHVGMLPVTYLKRMLTVCRAAGFEPHVVTLPSAVLAACYAREPQRFAKDALFLFADQQICHLLAVVDGMPKLDRLLVCPSSNGSSAESKLGDLKQAIELTAAAVGARYQCRMEQLYLLGDTPLLRMLGSQWGSGERQVTHLPLGEIAPGADAAETLNCLAALTAINEQGPRTLVDFRAREFAYSPRLKELLRALRSLLPAFLILAGAALLSLVGYYGAREYYLQGLHDEVAAEVRAALPGLNIAEGSELQTLSGEVASLEEQLKKLGSLSSYSLLDTFVALTEDVPKVDGVTFRSLSIRENKVKLEGTAPDYGAVEKIEKTLKSKRDIYRNLKSEVSSLATGVGGARNFTLEFMLDD